MPYLIKTKGVPNHIFRIPDKVNTRCGSVVGVEGSKTAAFFILGRLIDVVALRKKFDEIEEGWKSMSAFKYLMIFEGVSIEISHDDALKGFSFSRSDMLFNKFDQLLSFCGVIASLMSINVNDFKFLSQ